MPNNELGAAHAFSGTTRTRLAMLAAVTAAATATLVAMAFAALPPLIAAAATILSIWVGIESLFSP